MHARRYLPHQHELRWCPGECQRWYHVDCLGEAHKVKDIFKLTAPAGTSAQRPAWHKWHDAIHAPIARSPRNISGVYRAVPFSLEKIFIALRNKRAQYGGNRGLPDINGSIAEIAQLEERERKYMPQLIQDIKTAIIAAPNENIFQCIGGGCNEWI